MTGPGDGVRHINCPQCGGTLRLHGGHKVLSLTCGYCAAVLDPHEEFKVLAQFAAAPRPATPFEIGMRARFHDVEFTVIGLVRYACEGSEWLEHLLYSPTHGYMWLSRDRGHHTLSRRVRDLPSPPKANRLDTKSPVYLRGRKYRMYERYRARVTYVEGELTWIAQVGDRLTITECIAPPWMLSYERSGSELEYQLAEYIPPAAAFAAFGLSLPSGDEPVGVHPAQPFVPGRLSVALNKAGKFYALVALVLLVLVMLFGGGSTLLQRELTLTQRGELAFDIDDPDMLLRLDLEAPLANQWGIYDVDIVDAKGDAVFELEKEISYYYGREGGESWSEGAQRVSSLFKLPQAGRYRLEIVSPEGSPGRPQNVIIELHGGYTVRRYLLMLLLVSLLAAAWLPLKRLYFSAKRWAPVTEDEDD